MNRRNFLGNILAAGAGFFILPAAKIGEPRLWVPNREIVKAEAQSIWQTHYLSYEISGLDVPYGKSDLGEVRLVHGRMFYGTSDGGWLPLVKMSRPLQWKAGEHKNWNPVIFL